ncbi:hypothetical protein ACT4US_26475, partial [Bacillus sp. HC-Mk]
MMQSILRKQRLIILALLIVIITTIVVGMGLGSASLSYDRLLPTLMGQGTFKEEFVFPPLRTMNRKNGNPTIATIAATGV